MSLRERLNSLYREPESQNPLVRFNAVLDEYICKDDAVLDLGAGAGLNRYDIRGKAASVVGVDLDPRVLTNPLLDRGYVADISELPFSDQSFDVVFSIYVLEHIDDANKLVDEVYRVLDRGATSLP